MVENTLGFCAVGVPLVPAVLTTTVNWFFGFMALCSRGSRGQIGA